MPRKKGSAMAGFEFIHGEKIDKGDGVTVHVPPQAAETVQPEASPRSPIVQSTVSPTFTPPNRQAYRPPQPTPRPFFEEPVTTPIGRRVPPMPVSIMNRPQPIQPVDRSPALPAPASKRYEPRSESRRRTATVAGTLLALSGLAAVGSWSYINSSAEPNNFSTQPKAKAELPKGEQPTELGIPGISSTTPDETAPVLVPVIPTQKPTSPNTTTPVYKTRKSNSSTTSTKPNIVPPAVAATPITPSTSTTTTPETTPTPTVTQPEQAPAFPTAPSEMDLQLLSEATDQQRADELQNQDPNVANYLRAAQSGELNYISKNSISDYQQGPLTAVYKNGDARRMLGNPQLLDENTLRSGQNTAGMLVKFSDNALRHANEVFPVVGTDISKVAYLNDELSNALTTRLAGGEQVGISDSQDEAIIGQVQNVNGAMLLPVVSRYNNDAGDYTVFRWDALVPVPLTNDQRFFAVTVFEKQLDLSLPNNFTTPPIGEVSPTPGSHPTLPDATKNNAQNKHHHKHWWDSFRD